MSTHTICIPREIRKHLPATSYLKLCLDKRCGFSLEVTQQGASNKYPQHIFLWRNKKISTFGPKNAFNIELCTISSNIINQVKYYCLTRFVCNKIETVNEQINNSP